MDLAHLQGRVDLERIGMGEPKGMRSIHGPRRELGHTVWHQSDRQKVCWHCIQSQALLQTITIYFASLISKAK